MSLPAALLTDVLDPSARSRRLEEARRFAQAWRRAPWLAGLLDRLDAIDEGDAAAAANVLALARPMLERVDWVPRGIAAMARRLADDPLFEPPFRAVHDAAQHGLLLIDHPLLRVTVMALSADAIAVRKQADLGRRAIGFTGHQSLFRFERAAGVEIDLWESDAATDALSIMRPGRCRPAGRIVLTDGRMLDLDGARQAWTFARVPADILLIHASVRVGGAAFSTEYDASDGSFLAANASDTAVSRVQMIAAALGRMGRRDALPALAAIACEAPFALRWQIAREMAALDIEAALPTIRRMAATDPHREVRDAARATLALLAA